MAKSTGIDELVRHFQLKEHRKGPSRMFSPRGMLALMFLKSYIDCSDRKLIEHLNGNINFYMFCDIYISAGPAALELQDCKPGSVNSTASEIKNVGNLNVDILK